MILRLAIVCSLVLLGACDATFVDVHKKAKDAGLGHVACYTVYNPREVTGRYCLRYVGEATQPKTSNVQGVEN